jgi:hypothetical protein
MRVITHIGRSLIQPAAASGFLVFDQGEDRSAIAFAAARQVRLQRIHGQDARATVKRNRRLCGRELL